jgi:hypothetical protein
MVFKGEFMILFLLLQRLMKLQHSSMRRPDSGLALLSSQTNVPDKKMRFNCP